MTILIVYRLLKNILVDVCELDVAHNGKGAIQLAKKNKYSLILMDINLKIGFRWSGNHKK